MKSPEVARKFRRTIDRYRLIEKGDRLIVGVSAGVDSMVLLHLLNDLREELSLSLIVAHINHGLRPDESPREAELVQEVARRLHLPFEYETFDVKTFRTLHKVSLQEAARRLRFRFFSELLKKYGGGKIALGHQADDQVETFLLRLMRGSGLTGLKGMLPLREKGVIRPLLEIWKWEIEAYAGEMRIPYLTDSSNLKEDYLRNWIRLRLIPLLARGDLLHFKKAILKTIHHLGEEDRFIEGESERVFRQIVRTEEGRACFRFSDFRSLHPALQWRVLKQAVERVREEGDGVEEDWSEVGLLLGRLKMSRPSFSLQLSGGLLFERRYDLIELKRGLPHPIPPFETELSVPGTTYIQEIATEISAEVLPWPKAEPIATHPNGNVALLDFDRIRLPLRVRNLWPGDRFQPLGAKGSQKLKEFFIDHKVPRIDRQAIPLLITGDHAIAWVGGHRIDERFKVSPETKKVLRLTLIKRSEA
ncbi:MAG: tRNA lysidine(34) synthetase TilS [Desulfobacterota bacterium]|nr:tRNA lysidine(34) synthetase TilS [Thermodesulfobacteriota bacterium]